VGGPTSADDVYAVLRHREPSPAEAQALREFQQTVRLAGLIALAMIFLELIFRSTNLFGWIVGGAFVAWRSFVTVPRLVRKGRFHDARRKLLVPALINILGLAFVPGIVFLIAFFRSPRIEDAPPIQIDRID
jgi:hypothetical protein